MTIAPARTSIGDVNNDVLIPALREQLPEVLAVYLFGSQAQGTATADSDVDLAFLAQTPLDPVLVWEVASHLALLAGRDVDLVDLRRATTVMQHQVITTGQCLWTKERLPVALWEMQVMAEKMALDEARAPLLGDIARTGVIHGR